jgi:hypothetical protein
MDFGQYTILENLEYEFQKMPDWYWIIKAPTSGDELTITRFINQGRVTAGADGVSRDAPPSWLEVAYREIALTFAGTNIPISETNDNPCLKPNASVADVEKVLKAMPQEMVMEIWEAVRDHVPGWGPKAETEEEEEDETINSSESS